MISKYYHFIFNGHEYTHNDRADNQGMCPHCNEIASDGFMFDVNNDKECFLGYYEIDNEYCILCFDCPKCFKKFYYHMPITCIMKGQIADYKVGIK